MHRFARLACLLIITALISRGFMIGWAKPTPVNPYNLRYGRRGEAIVALAGPLSNLIMAAAVTIPLRLLATNQQLLFDMAFSPVGSIALGVAEMFIQINVILMIFNLLPIAPLDGWRVLLGLIDARTAYNLRQYEQYGFVLLLILVFAGGPILSGAIGGVMNLWWIGALTVFVLLEKLAPLGVQGGRLSGWLMLGLGLWNLVVDQR